MNCPSCGRLAFPRSRQCVCGDLLAWPPQPISKQKPKPRIISQRLRDLGIEQRPGESMQEFRERCRTYVLDRYVNDHAA